MSHKLYRGGEIPLVGDIVECRNNSGFVGEIRYGKQYTVKGVTENSCVQVVYGQGGFYADRFKLIRRKEQEAPVVHEGPEQIMEIKESPMWRQKTTIKVAQALLISGIVVFWVRMHGVSLESIHMESFWQGWEWATYDAKVHQSMPHFFGVVGRLIYELSFGIGGALGIMWACFALPMEINHYFFGGKDADKI